MSKLLVVGLSGPNGSGKDLVAQLLVKNHGFMFAGATEMFLEELHARNWPTDREHKSKLSAEWRREFGMGVIVDKALKAFRAGTGQYKGLVVGSLRHPGEADRLHELGGVLLWIDADVEIRYQRIRNAQRGRDIEDNKTFEEFLADEARGMSQSGDAATLNMSAVKERADHILWNNGSEQSILENELATLLQAIQ